MREGEREDPPGEGMIHRLVAGEQVEARELKIAAAAMGPAAIDPLLDGLILSGNREIRLSILECLDALGEEARERALQRVAHGPWYVTRNLLALLARGPLPAGFDPYPFLRSQDARVRVEAVGVARQLPDPTPALALALADVDPRVVTAALRSLEALVPIALLQPLFRIAAQGEIEELRVQATRALGRCPEPEALALLVELTGAKRRLLGGIRFPRLTPVVLEAVRGLAFARAAGLPVEGWGGEVLAAAGRSRDRALRSVAALD